MKTMKVLIQNLFCKNIINFLLEDSQEQKEEDGKGGEKDGENQLGAKDDDKKSKNKDPSEGHDEEDSEQNKKEINEMNEPEYDDEQTDPYHGNQPELPEPEPMDLPDNLQLDEGTEISNQIALFNSKFLKQAKKKMASNQKKTHLILTK